MGNDMEGEDGPIVVFELDGRSLISNHKGQAIDSFAPPDDRDELKAYSRDPDFDYMEDRIVLKNTRELKIPKNSVIAIHVILNEADDLDLAKKIFERVTIKKKFVYTTIKNFQQRKNISPEGAFVNEYSIQGSEPIKTEDDFISFLEDVQSGYITGASTEQDVKTFVSLYHKYKDSREVNLMMTSIVKIYKEEYDIKIRTVSDIMRYKEKL
jgi:hypothetical protein